MTLYFLNIVAHRYIAIAFGFKGQVSKRKLYLMFFFFFA